MMTASAKRKFAKLVQSLREELNFSQNKMGKALGVTQSTISQWENARFNNAPLWENIEALAKLRKSTVDDLCVEIGISRKSQEYDFAELKAQIRSVGLKESIELMKVLLKQIALSANGTKDFVQLAQFAIGRIEIISCSEEQSMASIGEALRAWMLASGTGESDVVKELEYYELENASVRVSEILAGDQAYEDELGAIATLIYGYQMDSYHLVATFGVKQKEAPPEQAGHTLPLTELID